MFIRFLSALWSEGLEVNHKGAMQMNVVSEWGRRISKVAGKMMDKKPLYTRALRGTRVSIIVLCILPAAMSQAETILGSLDAVTGVEDLQVSYGDTDYLYDVSFVSGVELTYNQVYASSPPTFYNNFKGAQVAATELANLFQASGVTSVVGATPIPISPGGPVQLEILTPYGPGPGADASGGYVAEETDYVSNRVPSWIPVGPGCCGGTLDIAGNPVGYAVYDLVSATPVPLPAAGWLLLSGMGGLGLLAHRRSVRTL